MTPERLAEIRKAAGAIEHRHVGPGRCSCGYNAYAEQGIMLDYHALIANHFDRVKRNPVRPANTEHVNELLAEVDRLTADLAAAAAKLATISDMCQPKTLKAGPWPSIWGRDLLRIIHPPRPAPAPARKPLDTGDWTPEQIWTEETQ